MRHWISLVESAQSGAPTISFPFLLHVGSMDASHKRKDSHEGHGLSVSLHPRAWRRIARGWVSGDVWKLTKPNNQFLDYHKLSKKQRKAIVEWGMASGYIEPCATYRIAYFDGDLDEETYQEFDSREEAEAENEYLEGEITEHVDGFISTPKLAEYCNLSGHHYVNCLDFVALPWADEQGFDGVWWQDRYEPVNLSAPRGVIFPDRVHTFKAEPATDDDGKDDDEEW